MAQAARKRSTAALKNQKPRSYRSSKAAPPEVGFAREAVALGLFVGGIFVALALWSYFRTGANPDENMMGIVGALIAAALVRLLGWCSAAVVIGLLLMSRRVWCGGGDKPISAAAGIGALAGALLMVSSAAAFVSVIAGAEGGGVVGARAAFLLVDYVSEAGTLLLTFALFFLALSMSTGVGTAALLAAANSAWRFLAALAADTAFFCAELLRGLSRAGSRLTGLGLRAGGAALLTALKAALAAWSRLMELLLQRLRSRAEGEPQTAVQAVGKPSKERAAQSEEDEWTLGEPPAAGRKAAADAGGGREHAVQAAAPNPEIRVLRQELREQPKLSVQKKQRAAAPAAEKRAKKAAPPRRAAKQTFELPPLDLLIRGDASNLHAPDDKTLIANSRRLEQALADFRVGGNVVEVQPGPVITLYQFLPAAGVKVQRIVSLADDLALTLRVASVRVYAPVPGKGTVGIEVPNDNRELVRLHDVLASNEFQQTKSELMIALGKDTFGNPYVANLARMPHLLIAGATGTGKSVFINSMLLSLLYRNTPEDLRFIMIDPKMLELSIYEGIPHLKAPVVTNPKRARGVLWWAVEEMERRYRLMKDLGVRNLASYNHLARGEDEADARRSVRGGQAVIELRERDIIATGSESAPLTGADDDADDVPAPPPGAIQLEVLPRIVIVVDELADLMLTVGREIEELFTRLAQKARAAGIHLVLATQRPSVNVITGLIKANFPARLSFKVASRIDSRTVLDDSGAERLLGDGDSLFLSPYTRGVVRLHGAFVSDAEVTQVVAALKQQGPPEYDDAIERMIEAVEKGDSSSGGRSADDEEYDPLYDEAVALVVEKGSASTSMVQRAFRIGYNRAARILETMERDGVVGPADGSRPRQILVAAPEVMAD